MYTRKIKTAKGDKYFFYKNNKKISPFHELDHGFTEANGKLYVNMVVEIPKYTKKKMEINTTEKYNPIKQDTVKNKLRFVAERKDRPTKKQNSKIYAIYKKIWKDKEGYNLFSYGAIPQTYENPKLNLEEYKDQFFYKDLLKIDDKTIKDSLINPKQIFGDGDPLDIFLIHSDKTKFKTGSFIKVEVLGIIPMIDDGEIDWKVMAKLPTDPANYQANIKNYINWFKYYKGKYANNKFNRQNIIFGNNEKLMTKDVAKIIIQKCNEQYIEIYSKSSS
jgi:inorganic pyrophosphatase